MSSFAGPVILDLKGTELSSEEKELLQHPLIGGIILFSRNYESPEQIIRLCQAVRQASRRPLLITVDHEGGRVQRFQEGFTRLKSMGEIGRVYDSSPALALKLAEICGWLIASEILSVGIDLSFAPVLDLNKKNNPAIGDRAFHFEPEKVSLLATHLMKAMNHAGMAATGKHFPGHGSVQVDSHADTPIDQRNLDEISREDLQPFVSLIQNGLQAIMPAHIIFPAVDKYPACFSRKWLQTILRDQLKFTGIIFSDDLSMNGASFIGDHAERAEAALEAGCDMILICNHRAGAIKILDHLPQKFFIAEEKFKKCQGKFNLPYHELKKSTQWQENIAYYRQVLE